MSELEYWIWFSNLRCLRQRTKQALMERFETPKGIWFAEEAELRAVAGILPDEVEALLERNPGETAAILRRCGEEHVSVLTLRDASYPERLRMIPDPPAVLYVKGTLPTVDAEAVIGVVGTRQSTPYGEKMARSIAYEIAARGGIVATGLAAGIDSRAAEGALMGGGKVIGVLGTAINEVYPSWNGQLYQDVQASGALVSEYPPDVSGSRKWFPRRNRIIAGLSVGVVVAEAPLKSGSLITAARALDFGRDVYAVPFNADAENGRGCNALLREGASMAENGWDVLKEYEALFPDRIRSAGTGSIPEELTIPAGKENALRQKEPEEAKEHGFFKLRIPVRRRAEAPAAPEKLEQQLSALNQTDRKSVV